MMNRKSESASTTDAPRLRRDTTDTECQTKDDDEGSDVDDDDDTEFQEFGEDQILTEDMAEEIYSALAGLDNTASTASTTSSTTTTTKDHED